MESLTENFRLQVAAQGQIHLAECSCPAWGRPGGSIRVSQGKNCNRPCVFFCQLARIQEKAVCYFLIIVVLLSIC